MISRRLFFLSVFCLPLLILGIGGLSIQRTGQAKVARERTQNAFNKEVHNNPASNAVRVAGEFEEVTAAAGITATHNITNGYLATGQAWGDYNGDGWVDLYLTNGKGANSLYDNNGDGTFSLSPLSPSVALSSVASGGALFGDFNNDGWKDLYVVNHGPNTLFRNESGESFTDVTTEAGVGDELKGHSAAWGDYDQDGYLDLYVVNQGDPPLSLDRLFHNNGDETFTDVSEVLTESQRAKIGFVASFVDFDNDGDMDIYLVVDRDDGNVLWRNDGPGCGHWCFEDVSVSSGADTQVEGMGLAVGDYDNDNDLDFYFSNGGPMVLLQNQTSQGSPTFEDVSAEAGVDFDAIGWGTIFFDYDNDGWLDIYLSTWNPEPALANRLFHNQADGTFMDVAEGSGADDNGPTLGVAYADYDQDGWVDLVIGNWGEAYRLYRNMGVAGEGNHWLTVELVGGGPVNRDAIGSRVLIAASDGRILMQEVKSGSSLGSGNEMALHFGLGEAFIESLTVQWADGTETFYQDVQVDQIWKVHYSVVSFYLPLIINHDGMPPLGDPGQEVLRPQ